MTHIHQAVRGTLPNDCCCLMTAAYFNGQLFDSTLAISALWGGNMCDLIILCHPKLPKNCFDTNSNLFTTKRPEFIQALVHTSNQLFLNSISSRGSRVSDNYLDPPAMKWTKNTRFLRNNIKYLNWWLWHKPITLFSCYRDSIVCCTEGD